MSALHRQIELAVPPARAFRAFTEQAHLWWPRGHTRRGGHVQLGPERFVELVDDEVIWELGQVVEWDPPDRLVYDFYPGGGPDTPTRVHIDFVAIASGGTRVEIVHTAHRLPVARFEGAKNGFSRAWPHVLAAYTQHLEQS